jgi:hypothetical protein
VNDPKMVYCGSPAAIKAATAAYMTEDGDDAEKLTSAFIAMHHPSLGLDRSVCLRDVVEWLERGAPVAAKWVREEFGSPDA